MKKTKKISHEDLEHFKKSVAGTKPLLKKKVRLEKPKEIFIKRIAKEAIPPEVTLRNDDHSTVTGVEYLSYHHSSIAYKILRKLRKGQYTIEGVLDLHGLTIEQAKPKTEQFLSDSLREGIRIVLIIHGKGRDLAKPILKNQLNQWLRSTNKVLAFCTALPKHGGYGAMYVLLKNEIN